MNEKLKLFKIEIDDIENINFENGMLQKIARQYADEFDLKRLELVLNENIITAKDKFTGIHSYMGMRVSLEPLEKDISFIVRPTDKPTYDDLQKQNTELKDNWNKLKEWLEEMINEIKTNDIYDRTEYECTQITTLENVLAKLEEIGGGING